MKRLLVILALVGLVVVSGCLGGGVVDETALAEPADYDWETNADANITITDGSYQAVLSMENRTNVSLFGPGEFGGEAALPVRAVKYRYPNGTVVNASALDVSERDERTVLEVPVEGGQLGYTAQVRSGELFLPVVVNGSHAVTLPAGAEVGAPIISRVTPGGYEVDRTGDRLTLRWTNPDSHLITVDYYQERNLYIFGGILGLTGLIAGAGLLYFRAQIRALAARRGEVGPTDLEED